MKPDARHSPLRRTGASQTSPLARPHFEPLESRLLMSADLPMMPLVPPSVEPTPTPAAVHFLAPRELVVLDGTLPDADTLREALSADRPDADLLVLDPTRDALDQIGDRLANGAPVSALHVVAHGQAGQFVIRGAVIDASELARRTAQLQTWNLADHADILLYGCSIAEGANGEAFVRMLAALTGADVAASINLTGTEALGGDWTLEFAVGEIDTATIAGPRLKGRWQGTLDAAPVPAGATAPTSFSTPLAFERNVGQTDDAVEFLARGSGYTVFLDDGHAVIDVRHADGTGNVVRLSLVGAQTPTAAIGGTLLSGTSHYLVGDVTAWRQDVAHYGTVRFDDVYDGVDVQYYGADRRLEFDFLVDSGVDTDVIGLRIEGAVAVEIADSGELVLTLEGTGRTMTFHAPVSYQRAADGTREHVDSRYALRVDGTVGFVLGDYDRTRELVIDPILGYVTYLGGTGLETIEGVETDSSGNVYVTGRTGSAAFPTSVGAYDTSLGGSTDAFVTKFDAAGVLQYSTYFGGSGNEWAYNLTVDGSGQVYVVGQTASSDFSIVNGADSSFGGSTDGFLVKLNAAGSAILYSTYYGGANADYLGAVHLGSGSTVYVAGATTAATWDGYVSAIDTALSGASSLLWSQTYAAAGTEKLYDMDVDSTGDIWVIGETSTAGLAFGNAYDSTHNGGADVFLVRMSASGAVEYVSYYGGTGDDYGNSIAVAADDTLYLTGISFSTAGIASTGAYDTAGDATNGNAFLVRLDPSQTGSAQRLFGTYYGTSGSTFGIEVALDAQDRPVLVGQTTGAIPTTVNARDTTLSGSSDGFIAIFATDGSALRYGSYLGGASTDWANAVAVDPSGRIYVVGDTASTNLHTTGAYDTTGDATNGDGFIAQFLPLGSAARTSAKGGLSINTDGGNDAYLKADSGGAILGGRTELTLEFDFAIGTNAGLDNPLLSYAVAGDPNEVYVNIKPTGAIQFGIESSSQLTAGTYAQLLDGDRHQVAVTWNRADGTVRFYVDGALVESFAGFKTGANIDSGGTLVIGQEQDSVGGGFATNQVFSGTLYDVRVFSDVRTATEIRSGRLADLPRYESGMVANWRFDDWHTDGTTTEAVSGNDLTLGHASGTGFVASQPSLTFVMNENAATGTVVGSITALSDDRQARIDALLAADATLTYSAQTDKFYKRDTTFRTWASALSLATSTTLNTVAGQLVTVRSATENALLSSITGGSAVWLGAADAAVEGTWRWYDGSTPADTFWQGTASGYRIDGAYTNWNAGEPSDTGGEDRLYQQADGTWNDAPDGMTSWTLIEWDADEVLDASQPITYSITTQTVAGAFAIDSDTGVLTVADGNLLDHETQPTHSITVRVTEGTLSHDRVYTIVLGNLALEVDASGPASASTAEDTARVFSAAGGNAVTVSDGTAGDTRLQVSLSVSHGTLTLFQTTGLTIVSGANGSSAMVLDGLESALNAALDGLTYAPASHYFGSDTLNVTTSLSADLAALYTFDGGTLEDTASGAPQNGSLFGDATITTDATRGSVLALDGSGDSARIASVHDSPTNVTIGGWVNLRAASTRAEFISLDDRVHIALDESGIGVKGSIQTGAGAWNDLPSGRFIAGGGWHHVMFVVDDTNDVNTLYIDGVAVASETNTSPVYWTGAATTYLGQHPAGFAYLNGLMDDVRIYTRALSGDEVAALAAETVFTDTAGVPITVTAVNDAPENLHFIPGLAESGLVGVYTFSAPNDLGRDDAGGDAPMTLHGSPTQTAGPSGGGALDLAGGSSGQYGDLAGITTGGAMTIAGQVRFDSTAAWQRIVDFGQANSTGITAIYVGRHGTTSDLTFTLEKDLGFGNYVVYRATAAGVIANGTWMHFTATVDASGAMALYINGALAASATGIVPEVGVRTNNYVGRSNWAGDALFDGAIDNLVVASGALSAAEVTVLHQQSNTVTIPDDTPDGTVLGTLIVADPDSPDTHAFTLTDSAGGRFAVAADGTITVGNGALLEHASATSHTFTARAADSGSLTIDEVFTVTLTAVNEAPSFVSLDGAPLYTEGGAAVVLDADVQITDPELSAADAFSGATVTLARNGGADADDALAFDGTNVTVSGADVLVGGVQVGTYVFTGGELVVTFGANATQARVDTLLRNIVYWNWSDAPPASVQIDWTFSDGNAGAQGSGGALAATGSTTVTITAVNDAPVNTVPSATFTAVNTAKVFSTANGNALQIADADAGSATVRFDLSSTGGTLTLASTTGLTLLSGGNGTGAMSYSGTLASINAALSDGVTFLPTTDFRGLATLTLTSNDLGNSGSGGALTDTDTVDVHVGAIVVTNTSDDLNGNTGSIDDLIASDGGDGVSLREAITAANNTAGADAIVFAIGGTGLHVISLASALPTISQTVTIDATTDDSFAANGNRPVIVLDGGGTVQDGLQFYAGSDGSTVRGLVIQNFARHGLDLSGSGGHTVAGNWIGLDSAGTGAAGNLYGINVWNSGNNVIGGSSAADRNVISGNAADGIVITTDNGTSAGNLIRGNYIGTDAAGTASVGNAAQGIWINAAGNTIGGTAAGEGNVISGATGWAGITLLSQASGTLIAGNLIGTDATGTVALGNNGPGIAVESANNTIGGITAEARNVISGNLGRGIYLVGTGATGNVVIGNYIGTDITGTQDLDGATPNGARSGVVMDQGASNNRIGTDADGVNDAAERNIISGNNWFGVEFLGTGTSGNVVQGNYIGTDATGLVALRNAQGGVSFWNGASNNRLGGGAAGAGNVISGHVTGVQLGNGVSDNRVQGNLIGLGADGSTVVGNTGVGILVFAGGTTAAVGNNVIGTNADGVDDAGEGNVISGNFRGIALANAEVSGTNIAGNLIGTDATGTLNRGNTSDGIYILSGANANLVGGLQAVQTNTIAFNGGDGIRVADATSTGNVFLRNSIHTNGGLGINLVGGTEDAFGVTANDAGDIDTGPNNLLNFVTLSQAVTDGSTVYVSGTYAGAGNTYYRIELFAGTEADPSGHGEGRTFLGHLDIPVGGGGSISGSYSLASVVPVGTTLSATVTRTDASYTTFHETSEFSNALPAAAPNAAPSGTSGTITATEDTPHIFGTADFGFGDPDGHALLRVWFDTLPGSGTLLWNGAPFAAGDWVDAADIAAGQLSYAPATNASGSAVASFTFRVQDDGGTLGGGSDTDPTANTITIDISAVNDAPTAIVLDVGDGAAIRLNTTTAGDQVQPTIAALPGGGWVAAWTSVGQDGDGGGIYAQRFDAQGNPLGAEFRVNADPVYYQSDPSIAVFDDGAFVVGWTEMQPGVAAWVEARVFAADGTPLTGDIAVSVPLSNADEGYAQQVVALGPDRWAIVWSNESGGTNFAIEGRIHDRAGVLQGSQFTVGASGDVPDSWAVRPFAVALADGGMAVTWTHTQAGVGTSVRLQLLNADGSLRGGLIVLGGASAMDVTQLTDGRLVVLATTGGTVYAHQLAADGTVLLANQVVTSDYDGVFSPAVTASGDGHAVIWTALAEDGITSRHVVQRFDAAGAALGVATPARPVTDNTGERIGLTTLADGTALLAWSATGLDGSGWGAYAGALQAAVPEGASDGTVVATVVRVADPDTGDAHSFSLANDAGGRFAIDPVTGEITVADGSRLDYETATAHTIVVRATDGGGQSVDRTLTIALLPVNEAPAFSGLDGTPVHVIGGSAVVLDADVTVSDPELGAIGYFTGASLSLARNGGPDAGDALAFDGVNVTTAADNVFVGGVEIGDFAFSGGELVVTFGANATQARVNTLLQNIVYSHTSGSPPASVQIDWIFSDGNTGAQGMGGALQAIGSTTVSLVAVNAAPTGSVTVTGTPADGAVVAADTSGLADADGLGAFDYQWLRDGAAIVGATASTHALGPADVGALISVRVSYTDGRGTPEQVTSAAVGPVAVHPDTPPVNAAPVAVTLTEDTVFAFSGADTISVSDANGNLTSVSLSVSFGTLALTLAGSASVSFGAIGTPAVTLSGTMVDLNATLASLAYTPDRDFDAVDVLTLVSTDGTALSDTDTITLTVTPVDDPPVLTGVTLSVLQGGTTTLSMSDFTIVDPDGPGGTRVLDVRNVSEGAFELTTAPGVPVTTFTYGDLAAGSVRFVHSGALSAPAFEASVRDGLLPGDFIPAAVGFTPTPVVTTPGLTPEEAYSIVLTPSAPTPEASPEPSTPVRPADPVTTSTEPRTSSGSAADSTFAGRAPGEVDPRILMLMAVPKTPPPADTTPTGDAGPGRPPAPTTGVSSAPVGTSAPPVMAAVSPGGVPAIQVPTGDAVTSDTARPLWDAPAPFSVTLPGETQTSGPENRSAEEQQFDIMVNGVRLTGVSLSVGVVTWALRAGGILSSLLASLPAWRFVDPLPVLERAERARVVWRDDEANEDEDDDARRERAVEDLFGGSS